jgi:ABC-type transport system substrate-binding protein
VSGGTLTEIQQVDTNTFDPAKMLLGGSTGQAGYAIYSNLISFDGAFNQVPHLALSLTGNATSDTWTLKLRPNVKFSDGTAFDSAAVMTNMQRLANPATGSPARPVASEIASMTTPDATTLVMKLTAPDATFDQALINFPQMNTVPSPTAVAKFGANYGKGPDTTVGAGPYVLKEWIPGDHSTYSKSTTYYGAPAKPYFDTLVLKVIIDPTARYNTFITNGGDAVMMTGGFPEVSTLKASYPTVFQPVPGVACDTFRMDTAPTDDFLVREAIVRGADAKAAITRAWNNSVQPAVAYQNPTSAWYSAGVNVPSYNPTKAKQDIQQYLKKTGKSSVDVSLISATSNQPIITALKQDWDKIPGLNVNVSFVLGTETSARITARNYTNLLHNQCPQTPRGMKSFWYTSPAGSAPNISYLSDAKLDAALDAANSTKDVNKQKAAVKDVSVQINRILPFLPLYQQNASVSFQKNIKGQKQSFADNVLPVELMWRAKS